MNKFKLAKQITGYTSFFLGTVENLKKLICFDFNKVT
jgi:hypothetical protein